MDLNALKLFIAAAQARSLSEGARRTGVPLPTLSRRVRKLEDDIGVRLLERGPQGISLTSAGAQLLADAEPALATLSQAQQRLYDASGVAGTLRVSIPPNFGPIWSIFSTFRQEHPAVRFELFATDRRVDLAADGIDIAVRVGEPGYTSYVGRTLFRFRHRVVAAPELLRGVELNSPADLGKLPCACWRSAGPNVWVLGGEEVPIKPILLVNDYTHLLRLAVTGQAVTEVPPFLAHRAVEEGALVEVLPAFPLAEQTMRALVVDVRGISPLLRRFLDFISTAIPETLGQLVWESPKSTS